jgi:dTDP-4-dehydrorhamnose reductase
VWRLAVLRPGGLWHYSDAGVASWYDFAVAIYEEGQTLGLRCDPVAIQPISAVARPTPARRPPFSLLDSSRTREVLDVPAVHWRVQLRAILGELAAISP